MTKNKSIAIFLSITFIVLLTSCGKMTQDTLGVEYVTGIMQVESTSMETTVPETTLPETTTRPLEITQSETTTLPEPTKQATILEDRVESMTLEEKVGQMFIARCPKENAILNIEKYHLGGYILFARDFQKETPDTAKEKISGFQSVSRIPMLIAVDEEGGKVVRVSQFPAFRAQPFLSPQELYAGGGFLGIQADTIEKCNLLKSLGINVNLAPVCDISQNPEDYIYPRTFGRGATQTGTYVETVVSTMHREKMGSVLKHFPGYGNNINTHTGIAYDERPIEQFRSEDFIPFQTGIQAGADAVLVSHNIVKCMDATMPASLSTNVHSILRQELRFNGVIITDDLAMQGILDFIDSANAAVTAVLAGNDLLCCTDFETQIPAVLEAVRSGQISEERIDESVLRILKWKENLKILN